MTPSYHVSAVVLCKYSSIVYSIAYSHFVIIEAFFNTNFSFNSHRKPKIEMLFFCFVFSFKSVQTLAEYVSKQCQSTVNHHTKPFTDFCFIIKSTFSADVFFIIYVLRTFRMNIQNDLKFPWALRQEALFSCFYVDTSAITRRNRSLHLPFTSVYSSCLLASLVFAVRAGFSPTQRSRPNVSRAGLDV